ncbi:hypothetical protein LSH36_1277g00009 [Paralvinella palmiformis]|uniref:Uncharacterized protein n=1 Tax=Paralvinella palmiformis TaxID=53620 RepID=A0AAD9MNV0_9ANNE|nr:hypothetical protein LSH36_1277g00009 [Paralvinella palmiformis]
MHRRSYINGLYYAVIIRSERATGYAINWPEHWNDEYLRWNVSEYGGLTRIIVPPQLIWLPDFGLENSADAIYDDQADRKFRAGVDHDGEIQWVPGGKFITSCQLDITLYPFDYQQCELDFVDWTYDGRFVNLLNGTNTVGLDVYKKHGEWDIIKTEALKLDQFFDSDPGIPFPTVKFILYLKRKPKFYMINVVAPCILMSILALLVFYLPPDSGEKVSLGITVLLSFSVFLLLIAENVPKTSDCVPLIGIYLTMVMVMTGFSIVISVIVLDLHHHEPNAPVPRWLRKLVFGCMARLLCIFTPYQHEHSSVFQIAHGRATKGKPHPSSCNANPQEQVVDEEEACHLEENNIDGLNDGMHPLVRGLYDELEAIMAPRKSRPVLDEILQHLMDITSKMKRNIKRDQIKEEWKMLAKIIDRFLLVMFLIAITGLTVSILYIYPSLAVSEEDWALDHSR